MNPETNLAGLFCRAVGAVKRAVIDPGEIQPSAYLGGDLGIDSIEMLEIWFRMERELGLHLPDGAKRDIYTVAQVLEVFDRHLGPQPIPAK